MAKVHRRKRFQRARLVCSFAAEQLERDDIGKIIKNLPFGNWKDDFERLTLNETNVKNDFISNNMK